MLVRVPIAILVLTVSVALGTADGAARAAQPAPALAPSPIPTLRPALSRIVSARIHHTRLKPIRNSNARRLGRSLASLRPTWVTGTLRYARNQYPKHDEVRAWREIRRIVRAHSPGAQFDVVLNALQYRTPAAIQRTMRRMRAKLHPEGWFFDFLSNGFMKHPKMVRAAIASAHAHGEWLGGNVFGLAKRRVLPANVDFYSVQDHVFHLNLPAVKRLARRRPVVYHLNSDPAHERSGGCRFIERLSTSRRRAHIRRRAAQQDRWGFRFSYPVLFPQCLRKGRRGNPRGGLRAYNAFRDPRVAREIRRQLDRHELPPPG